VPRASKAAGSVALVTGANRGIGLGFVAELAARGARKIYAGIHSPDDLTDQFKDLPVEVVRLDVTDLTLVQAVADTDFMAVEARARYARDPVRYERGMTKLLRATVMDTGR